MDDQYILTPYYLDEYWPELEALSGRDWQVNKPELPAGEKQARMGALYQALATAAADWVQRGLRPVSIAGDCCTSIGILAGLQRAGLEPSLIWLDAHGDFNTWETTPSGFLGGMPLAMLTGRGEQTLLTAVGMRPIADEQVLLSDGRDLDPGEQELLVHSAVAHLKSTGSLLDYDLPARPLYIHFDTDIVNPQDAAAMNYLTPGGPSADELEAIFRRLARSSEIVAVSMSTWNPRMVGAQQAQQVCMRLLDVLLSG